MRRIEYSQIQLSDATKKRVQEEIDQNRRLLERASARDGNGPLAFDCYVQDSGQLMLIYGDEHFPGVCWRTFIDDDEWTEIRDPAEDAKTPMDFDWMPLDPRAFDLNLTLAAKFPGREFSFDLGGWPVLFD